MKRFAAVVLGVVSTFGVLACRSYDRNDSMHDDSVKEYRACCGQMCDESCPKNCCEDYFDKKR